MSWRHQPPTAPPLPFSAIVAGARASFPSLDGAASSRDVLRQFYGSHEVWLVDSGTSGLMLALMAVRLAHPGRPVAMPAFSCYDLATAAVGAGVEVVLYDVDPNTLGPDVSSLRYALTHRPAAVVVAPLYGMPVDMDAIAELAKAVDATVIEDAAQSIGATWKNKPLGALGSIGILSFGRGKSVTAGGGGAVLINDQVGTGLMGAVRDLVGSASSGASLTVKSAAQWALARPSLYRVPASIPWLRLGETIYREPSQPRGMSASSERMLRRTWPLVGEDVQRRRANARFLAAAAAETGTGATPSSPEGAKPGYLRFPLVFSQPIQLSIQDRRLGIERAYPTALSAVIQLQPLLAAAPAQLDGAQQLSESMVTLPTHRLLSGEDLLSLQAWMEDQQHLRPESRRPGDSRLAERRVYPS